MRRPTGAPVTAACLLVVLALAPGVVSATTLDPATHGGAPALLDRFSADPNATVSDFASDPRAESAVEPAPPTPALEVIGDAASDGPFDIAYSLPEVEPFALGVYDAAGRLVVELDDGVQGAGEHLASWDPSDTGEPAGVYFVVLSTGDERRSVRVARTP